MDNQLAARYTRNLLFVSREIADEVILVPIRRSADEEASLFTLNEVGAFIWSKLDGQYTLQDILTAITAEFDVPPAVAETDLLNFVGQLKKIGAVKPENP